MHSSALDFSIRKEDVSRLMSRLKKNYEIIAPVKKGKDYDFQKIVSFDEMVLDSTDYQNTRFPPKKFFIPNPEILFTFKKGRRIKLSFEVKNKKRLIFGIRPCDVNGLLVLDKIFIDDYNDPFYQEKRDNTILIALNCSKPGDYCFCDSLGTDKIINGTDLLLTDLGNEYFVKIYSDAGKKIVKDNEDLFKVTHRKIEKPKLRFKRKVNAENLVESLNKGFNNKIWKREADRCITCAACTIVCPTCYCYDILDEMNINGKEGKRIRKWNFCMLLNFSRVAGGTVFRQDRTERLKQFVCHKLCYFKETNNVFLCVGCGRCIQSCIVDIDLTKIANELSGKK